MRGLQGSILSLWAAVSKSRNLEMSLSLILGLGPFAAGFEAFQLFKPVVVDYSSFQWIAKMDLIEEPLDERFLKMHESQFFDVKSFSKQAVLGKLTWVDSLSLRAAAPLVVKPESSDELRTMKPKNPKTLHQLLAVRLLTALNTSEVSLGNPPLFGQTQELNSTHLTSFVIPSDPLAFMSQKRGEEVSSAQQWNPLISRRFKRMATRAPKVIAWVDPEDFTPVGQKIGETLGTIYYQTLTAHLTALQPLDRSTKPSNAPLFAFSKMGYLPRSGITEPLMVASQYLQKVSASQKKAGGYPDPVLPELELKTERLTFVEAADPARTPIYGLEVEVISSEAIGHKQRGWQLALAQDHWSTLFWSDSESKASEEVPLFHQNTIRLLERMYLEEATQQPRSGIIYGNVPAGWQVDIAKSDLLLEVEPVYFDLDSQPVTPDQTEVPRFFAFLAVNPGSRVIYLHSTRGIEDGGLAIPVLPATATYVNLEQISVDQKFNGILYDENESRSEQLWPLGGSTVRMIGQPHAVTVTDVNGYFEIKNVVTVGSYPAYVESYKVVEDEPGMMRSLGFTHRYRVNPQDMENQQLFRISPAQIKGWMRQVPEGVSQESGLLVAAFHHMRAITSEFKLLPGVTALPSSADLVPSAYTLSQSGYLQSSTYLQPDQNRILGIQLPEGPVVVKLHDDPSGEMLWSELVFASPGVVSMVGPYSLKKILSRP